MGEVTDIEQDLVVIGSVIHESVLPLFQNYLDISHPLEIPVERKYSTEVQNPA